MGVDAKLFIAPKWTIENVQSILKNHLGIKEQVLEFHNWAPDYVVIQFEYQGEKRMLHVHSRSQSGGFEGITLSFRAWGKSTEILQTIGKVTGGFFAAEDCSGDWNELVEAERHDLKFLVDHALIGKD